MNRQDFVNVSERLILQMSGEGYSEQILRKNRWMLDLFEKYCDTNNISDITLSAAADFVTEHFGFDIFAPEIPIQSAIRYPILTLFEFEKNGRYAKAHTRPDRGKIPQAYGQLFQEYDLFVDSLELKRGSRQKRRLIFAKFANYLDSVNVHDIALVSKSDIYGFIESMDGYAPKSLRGYKVHIRMLLDWLHENGHISFSGRDALPVIQSEDRTSLMSYYTNAEISQILSSIDIDGKYGKFCYCAVCFFAYLGMRASDVIRLKFSDIDWNKGQIQFTQYKTGLPLTLPLLDEVKYPLIDYIRNARYAGDDKEHIFISLRSPHKAYSDGNAVYTAVSRCIDRSGVDTDGRHRGPHALRHSLATNLMNENVQLSEISDILGHSSTVTTEIYLTIDEKNLKEISLEVPHA